MKKLISITVCFCLVICLFLGNTIEAFADPFTAVQIGAAAYAAMSSWGISFTAGNATAAGMGDFMGQQVEDYVNSKGGTIASVFGSDLAMNVAGKMAAGYQMYNALIDFKDWLVEKYSISAEDLGLTTGEYDGYFLPVEYQNKPLTGNWIEAQFNNLQTSKPYPAYTSVDYYYYGTKKGTLTSPSPNRSGFKGIYEVFNDMYGNIIIRAPLIRYDTGASDGHTQRTVISYAGALPNTLSWNGSDYVAPTVIDPSYEWLGQVGDYQDTNLDQLLGHVLEDVEGNNLVVVGELSPIDPPQPTPTPMPIDPDTPLQDVPWEGLDNNLQQLYEQGLEEIGTIGDARDAITDAVGEQTGVLEGAISDNASVVSGAIDQAVSDVGELIGTQTGAIDQAIADNAGVVSGAIDQAVSDVGELIGTQTGAIDQAIADNAGVVSGAIDQAVSDVQTAIGEQTAALDESLSATAEGVETIAEAIEDEAINWRKFDLRGLFPFCIPFDIYNMLNALDASPTAPHVQIPFVIQSLGFSYLIDLDFSAFDPVAAIMRQMELICYGLALAWATSKVIKW